MNNVLYLYNGVISNTKKQTTDTLNFIAKPTKQTNVKDITYRGVHTK